MITNNKLIELCRYGILLNLAYLSVGTLAVGQQYVEILRLESISGFGQTFDSLNTPAVFNEGALDFTLPVPIEKFGGNLITGFLVETSNFSIYPNVDPVRVFGTAIKVGINKKINDRLSMTAVALPKLSSDMKKVVFRDLQIGGLMLFKFERSKNLNYRFGMYANGELFGPFLVPIAGIYIKKSLFEINANLPLNADIGLAPAKWLRAGGRFQGINKTFHLRSPQGTYVERAYNEAGLYVQFISGPYNFMLFGGHSFLRSYRVYPLNDRMDMSITALRFGKQRVPINDSFGNSWLVKAAFFLRIPTN